MTLVFKKNYLQPKFIPEERIFSNDKDTPIPKRCALSTTNLQK
jgi:hypothetical protein